MREWWSAADLAKQALPGLPTTERGIAMLAERRGWLAAEHEGFRWRARAGRGGGVEFHTNVLPLEARLKLVVHSAPVAAVPARKVAKEALATQEMWAWLERQPENRRTKAGERLDALHTVEALAQSGTARSTAFAMVAEAKSIPLRTLYDWAKLVEFVDRGDWLPYLAPRFAGGGVDAECSDQAWDALRALYLRQNGPDATTCVRDIRAVAAQNGWKLPSDRTLFRRLKAIDPATKTLKRQGVEALKRMLPAQQRDRSGLHALEAVNADGHRWDVFVKWEDGTIERPMMTAFQDIYSGMILSWRIDRSENWHAVRLAFGDLVEKYGIPDRCLFDNGRHYASKKITGGTKNRFRFKVREEEPEGILTALGVQIHWATPYHGQSKPIERAFRDFARGLAKHPLFEGAYTGNSPVTKPEHYGTKAVPIAVFLKVLEQGITEHNQRTGRTGGVCAGRSFEETFNESYAAALIRKATPEQRRLWLLAAEAVAVNRQDGTVTLMGNRYQHELLSPLRGKKVTVRFDPENLHQPLHIYRLDGGYICAASCIEKVGFFDVEAAQATARRDRAIIRHKKAAAELEAPMSLDEAVVLTKRIDRLQPPPAPRLVRLFHGTSALKQLPMADAEEDAPDPIHEAMRAARLARTAGRVALRAVPDPDDAD
ncbi:transposase domain-containing protein [Humitalea sp. 24SJ18S-53]|uniref:transposase domain-containing protein n=1 Tax=Humitalea sp. 24SJ18S-53 TaxID=3422307 RepID=UPI003D666E5E